MMKSPETLDDFWADAEVIHTYTRKQTIDDGYLVDVSTLAKEAGFVVPVTITREVWTRFVEWPEEKGRIRMKQADSGMSFLWHLSP